MSRLLQLTRSVKFRIISLFLVIFFCSLLISLNNLDPDFGWHLKSGEYIIDHGIPTHDIFSYTAPDFPWINHEWLSDVATATLYRIGGFILVAIFFSILWALAFLVA